MKWHWVAVVLVLSLSGSVARGADPAEDLRTAEQTINSGHFAEGLILAQNIAAEAEARGDSLTLATALMRVSDAHYYLGEKEATLAPLQRALALFEGLQDNAGIGRVYYSLAYYYERSDPGKMIELLEKGSSFAEKVGDERLIMNIANATGVACWNQGRYPRAIEAFEKSIALARRNNDPQALASASQNVGLIHLNQGRPQAALKFFHEAAEVFRQGESTHNLAVVLGNTGNAYLDLRDYEKAMAFYTEAVEIHHTDGYLRGEAINLDNLAKIHRILQEWDEARDILLSGIKVHTQLGDTRNLVLGYASLGGLAQELGNSEQAADYLEKAMKLAADYGDPYLLAGLEISKSQQENNRGNRESAKEWLDKALAHAREVDDRLTIGIALAQQAEFAAEVNCLPRARELLSKGISIHEEAGIKTRTYLWSMRLARYAASEGDTTEARAQFEKSIELVDQLDAGIASDRFRMGFFREVAGIYHHYSAWLASMGEPLHGMMVLDRGRARVLALRLKRFNKENIHQENSYWDGRSIQPGALHVSYSAQDDTLLVFSLHHGRAACRKVTDAAGLMGRARMYAELVSETGAEFTARTAGQKLFKDLLQPELKDCPTANLLINPDGDLWTFPFSALITETGDFLAEQIPVSFLPSWSTGMRLASRAGAANNSALVLANSEFGNKADGDGDFPDLPDLRNTAAEGRDVAAHFSSSRLLLDASESLFRNQALQSFSVVHFATHCLTDPLQPLLSGIVMNPSETDDGLLQAREIHNLDLSCDLAVVSGCRSGAGVVLTGEGLLGITHSLLSAGCRAAVISRWDVDDRAAGVFMKAFYEAMETETPSSALALAQSSMRSTSQWKDPCYWAGFYLAGNGDLEVISGKAEDHSGRSVWLWGALIFVTVLSSWLFLKRSK